MFFYLVLGFSSSSEAKTIGFRWMFDSPGFSNLILRKSKCFEKCIFFTLFSFVSTSSEAKHRWNSVHVRFAWVFKACFMKQMFWNMHVCLPCSRFFDWFGGKHSFYFRVLSIRLGFPHLLHDNFVLTSACVLACSRFSYSSETTQPPIGVFSSRQSSQDLFLTGFSLTWHAFAVFSLWVNTTWFWIVFESPGFPTLALWKAIETWMRFWHRSRFLGMNAEHLLHDEWLSTRLGSQRLFYERKKVLWKVRLFFTSFSLGRLDRGTSVQFGRVCRSCCKTKSEILIVCYILLLSFLHYVDEPSATSYMFPLLCMVCYTYRDICKYQ